MCMWWCCCVPISFDIQCAGREPQFVYSFPTFADATHGTPATLNNQPPAEVDTISNEEWLGTITTSTNWELHTPGNPSVYDVDVFTDVDVTTGGFTADPVLGSNWPPPADHPIFGPYSVEDEYWNHGISLERIWKILFPFKLSPTGGTLIFEATANRSGVGLPFGVTSNNDGDWVIDGTAHSGSTFRIEYVIVGTAPTHYYDVEVYLDDVLTDTLSLNDGSASASTGCAHLFGSMTFVVDELVSSGGIPTPLPPGVSRNVIATFSFTSFTLQGGESDVTPTFNWVAGTNLTINSNTSLSIDNTSEVNGNSGFSTKGGVSSGSILTEGQLYRIEWIATHATVNPQVYLVENNRVIASGAQESGEKKSCYFRAEASSVIKFYGVAGQDIDITGINIQKILD